MNAAYRIPNHDGYLLAGSDCDNSAMDAAREAMTDEQVREIVVSVADSFGGHDAFATLEAFADQIDTLASAHWMLDQLFTRQCSVGELMESQRKYPERAIALRALLHLTKQCSRAVDDATTDKAREILDGWRGEAA
jgi:hypothetical protein